MGPPFSVALPVSVFDSPLLSLLPVLGFCLCWTTTLGASELDLCFGLLPVWGVVVVCGVVVVGDGVVVVVVGVVLVVVGVVVVSVVPVVAVPVVSWLPVWGLPPLGSPSAEALGPDARAGWVAAPPSPATVRPPPASASRARAILRRCRLPGPGVTWP